MSMSRTACARNRATPATAPDYIDHRQVLDRKDIDAVVIATPDHWHVPITIDAVSAGKDVYCEKPVTHTLAEGAPLIAAVKESKRVVQTGTQQRSWAHYMHAKELIAGGGLGQVTFIRTYWYQNHIANQDAAECRVASSIGNGSWAARPSGPFDADQYAHWRWYWDFGGGAMTDLFIHWVDVAQWYMNDDTPVRATATRCEGAAAAAADAGHHVGRAAIREGDRGVRQLAARLHRRRRDDDSRHQGGHAAASQRVRSL